MVVATSPSSIKSSTPTQHRPAHPRHRRRRPGRAPPIKPLPFCIVCSKEEDPKRNLYKCPKCLARYCSVVCFKEHKTICPGKPPSENTKQAQSTSSNPTTSKFTMDLANLKLPPALNSRFDGDEDDEEFPLTETMTEAIQKSSWLGQELQDGGLKELIRTIVATRNVDALALARQQYPQFDVFVDKLLVLAGVLEREPTEEESLEEWLQESNWSQGEAPNLLLAPAHRRIPEFQPVEASSSSEEESENSSSDEDTDNTSSQGEGDSSENTSDGEGSGDD